MVQHTTLRPSRRAQAGRPARPARQGRPARRTMTAVGLGAAALLALTAGGAGPGGAGTGSPTAPANEKTATETGGQAGCEGEPSGETETFTTEGGTFSFEHPSTWTVEQLEYDDWKETVGFTGVPYEVYTITDKDDDVVFFISLGTGPTDGDGPRPELVEVLEVEDLTGPPIAEGDTGPWFRTVLLTPNEDFDFTGGGDYALSMSVTTLSEGVDPQSPESLIDGWTYFLPHGGGEDFVEGTANFLFAGVDQPVAEALTGQTGEEAMRAFPETTEYQELRGIMTSMTVNEDALPE